MIDYVNTVGGRTEPIDSKTGAIRPVSRRVFDVSEFADDDGVDLTMTRRSFARVAATKQAEDKRNLCEIE